MLVKIMRRGDRVLSIEKNRIVVLRKSGEAEVFTISRDRVDGFPKLVRELKVTFGHDEIELDEPGRGRSKGRVKIMTAG